MLIKVNCKHQKFDKTFKSNKKHQQFDFAVPETKKNPQPLTFPLTFETGKKPPDDVVYNQSMGPAGAATLDKRRPDIRDELGYIAPPNRKLPPVPGSNYNTCDRVKRGTVISKCGERFDQIAFSDFFDRSLMKILSLSKYNVIREVFCVVLDVPFYNYC